MSVIVKGLNVPKNCYVCDYPLCGLWGRHEVEWQKENRDKECPIIVLPPHGRLIDADALEVHDGWLRDSKYFSQDSSHTHITFVYSNDIITAPTILEAEVEDGTLD